MIAMEKRMFYALIIGLFLLALIGFLSGRDRTFVPHADINMPEETGEELPTETESEELPVEVAEAFQILNAIEDAAEFDAEYERLRDNLRASGLEEEWNALLADLSAYYDYLQEETLTRVMSSYRLTGKSGRRYLDLDALAALVGDGFGSNFMERLYVEGSLPKLPPAVWRQEDLYAYCGYGSALDMLMISAEELEIMNAVPQTRTALLVDASEAIYVEGKGLLPMQDADDSAIAARAQKVYKAIRKMSENKIAFTGNPALADMIITMRVTYPGCGMRWTGKRNVLVFGCRVYADVRQVTDGKKTSFRAISEPEGRVAAEEGVDTVWMDFPEIIDEYSPQKFTQTVLSWYGIEIEIDDPPEDPEPAGGSETTEEPEDGESTEEPEDGEDGESTEELEDGEDGESTEEPEDGEDGESTEEPEDGEDGESTEEPEDGEDGESTEEPEDGEDGESTEDGGDVEPTEDGGDSGDREESGSPESTGQNRERENTAKTEGNEHGA